MIDISGLNKAKVLAGLYNNSKPVGLGQLRYQPKDMTEAEAETALLHLGPYFDYLNGRVMKVNISNDTFDPYLYDRDNGQGAAQRVIDNLK